MPDLHDVDNVLSLLRGGDEVARRGLELKAFGNQIQELAGGRAIHPVNVEAGGVLFFPERADLTRLIDACAHWRQDVQSMLTPFAESDNFPAGKEIVGRYLSIQAQSALQMSGTRLQVAGIEPVAAGAYRELIEEHTLDYSNASASRCRGEPLLAGALARIANSSQGIWPLLQTPQESVSIHQNNRCQALNSSRP